MSWDGGQSPKLAATRSKRKHPTNNCQSGIQMTTLKAMNWNNLLHTHTFTQLTCTQLIKPNNSKHTSYSVRLGCPVHRHSHRNVLLLVQPRSHILTKPHRRSQLNCNHVPWLLQLNLTIHIDRSTDCYLAANDRDRTQNNAVVCVLHVTCPTKGSP
jgi:hypothetical protein